MLGSTEIIVLVVVIGVLIFGAKKIPELAKTFGKAKGEFEKGKIEADKDLKEFKEELDKGPKDKEVKSCLLYTSPSPRDRQRSRMPSSA